MSYHKEYSSDKNLDKALETLQRLGADVMTLTQTDDGGWEIEFTLPD